MCPNDARRALCLLLLLGPACSITSGDGEFLLEETEQPDDPATYTLVHLKVEDGGQAAYQAQDLFVDGDPAGQVEPTWALDGQSPVAAGTHTFELVGYHIEGLRDRGQVIHDDVPALTLDPVTLEPNRTYVLAALEEDGASTQELVPVEAPAQGAAVLVWNLSGDPLHVEAWPDADPCGRIGDEWGVDGEPVDYAVVAPGERTMVPVTDYTLPLTFTDARANVWPMEAGSVSLAIAFPPLSDAADAAIDYEPELHATMGLVGRKPWELDQGCPL